MPAVTLNKGRYYVGNPLTIFPNWKPSPSQTYRVGMHTFHAFEFKNSFVAAIPVAAIAEDVLNPKDKKKTLTTLVTFDRPTVFFEQDGEGAIGTIQL
jgi:hypothetical protein